MNTKTAKMILLYVEDEVTDVLFMKKALKRVGADFALETVSDGQQAIDYLNGAGSFADRSKHPLPDLILLDVNLPARSGLRGFAMDQGTTASHGHSGYYFFFIRQAGRPVQGTGTWRR